LKNNKLINNIACQMLKQVNRAVAKENENNKHKRKIFEI